MTDTQTASPTVTDSFWAQRDADRNEIADMIRQTIERISVISETDYYRDGLPPIMAQTQQSLMMHANQLVPSIPMIPAPIPFPIPQG